MSESRDPAPDPASEPVTRQAVPVGRARYQRSTGGLLTALVVTVVAVVGFTLVRGLLSDDREIPVRAVDYQAVMKAARGEAALRILGPDRLPLGWKATSAVYDSQRPSWRLGVLTDDEEFVGLHESFASTRDMVEEFVDEEATKGEQVTVAGAEWTEYTDTGGDYALVRRLTAAGGREETLLVIGTAPREKVREFAASLPVPGP